MRKGSAFILSALLVMAMPAMTWAESASELTDGTYEATVSSVGGPMTVSVTVEGGALAAVEVTEVHDTEGVRDEAIVRLPQMMVENQSVNVDGVTGATLTSTFLKMVVRDALTQAGNKDGFNEKVEYAAPAQTDMDVDVVVVGGGLAGMSAGAAAAGKGLSVVVLEKNGFPGGNSLISDNYIGRAMAEPVNSAYPLATADFQSLGLQAEAVEYYGMEGNRLWIEDVDEHGICTTVVNGLRQIIEDHGGLVLTETPGIGLIIDDGAVKGVIAQPKNQDSFNINAKAVVLSTGGFAFNQDLVNENLAFAKDAPAIGLGGNTGDALEWVKDVDAKLVAMQADDASFYSVSANLGYYADYATTASHYVDENGDLLTEDTGYSSATKEIYGLIGKEHYYVIETLEDLESTGELANDVTMAEYEHFLLAGSVVRLEGIQAIKDQFGLPNLDQTFEQLGLDPEGTYYVSEAKAGIYGTYGGIDIDDESRALNNNDEPIPGLYAAGEVIGSREYRLTGAYGGGLGTGYATGWIAAQTIAAELAE